MLIVDVMNVIHAAGDVDPRLGGLGPLGLARLVEGSRFSGEGVILVCDGTGGGLARSVGQVDPNGPMEGPGVRWAFAGPGRDADSLIQRILDSLERGGRVGGVKVVSDDKGVLAAAVGARAKRMRSGPFVRALVEDSAKGRGAGSGAKPMPDPAASHAWLREFGLGPAGDSNDDWPTGIDPDDLDTGKWVKDVERKPTDDSRDA